MKEYVSPEVDFITLGAQNVIIASPECSENLCNDNIVCPEDEACPTFVCPTMYGSVCGQNPYA